MGNTGRKPFSAMLMKPNWKLLMRFVTLTNPIWWVVPYAVGGSSDVVSRLITTRLGERLNQRILIDNKPGAGAAIGQEFVARAAPDGYTVLYDAFALAVNPSLRKLRFDPEKDLVPVTQVSNMWVIMVAPASAPYNTFAEFLDYARKNPDKATYGTTLASAGHFTAELFKSQAKLDMVHIPYKGGGPGVTAAMAGEVSIYYATGGSGMAAIRSGRLKALAVTSPTRYSALPNVPTFVELGYPEIVASEWNGLFAPRGTPAEIIQLLNREVHAVLADPRIREATTSLGIEIVTSTPQEFGQFVQNETRRWGGVIRQFKISVD